MVQTTREMDVALLALFDFFFASTITINLCIYMQYNGDNNQWSNSAYTKITGSSELIFQRQVKEFQTF